MQSHHFTLRTFFLCGQVACSLLACSTLPATDWKGFDVLKQSEPPASGKLGHTALTAADQGDMLRWGEEWFRNATFGSERSLTDVVGMLNGTVQVPCAPPSAPGCMVDAQVIKFYAAAIDKLDGVPGNLYVGNGGPDGSGYTHDLVLEFPKGTRLHGFLVPERLHTGMDVEAGAAWPLGIAAVPVPENEADQPYFVHPGELGVGPSPKITRERLGMTCALCHYSLDVDWDGKTDLHSAQLDRPTPGSQYKPQDAWPVGNQDLHIGWLFALAQNPLVGMTVFSGPVGHSAPEDALRWVNWVRDNYERSPSAVLREVVRGMLAHPRGYADVSPNALQDNVQFPILLTRRNWPSDYDGALVNPADRNSGVWTSAFDFTTLVGLAADRSAAGQRILYWEPVSPYRDLPAATYADIMVRLSPAVLHDPSRRKPLVADILGTSDGLPGLLDPSSLVVMEGPGGILPPAILNHPDNLREHRIRTPADYGGDAAARGPLMALVGLRIKTPPAMQKEVGVDALRKRYPNLQVDEIASDAVALMLDGNEAPANLSPLLARAWPLVQRGYAVFKASGCANCHAGPLLADNRVHPLSLSRRVAVGLPETPSTAGWRRTESLRAAGPALDTEPQRTLSTRPLQRYAAPEYDPQTGEATAAGGPLPGFLGRRVVGYKTTQLRYLWGSAPYLHDGGVGVALRPGAAPAGDDLQALLSRPASDKWYGMGILLAQRERDPDSNLRADAALSLQALLLKSERARVIAGNQVANYPLTVGEAGPDAFGETPPEVLSATQLGIAGVGHDFYIDDIAGGASITALVAFLLALDGNPGAPHE